MIKVAQALYGFFSSFDIPAYPEESIPDNALPPYITYTLSQPYWGEQASIQVRVWYPGNSVAPVFAKADEIMDAISYSGVSIPIENGNVIIYQDDTAIQLQPYDSPNYEIKVAYLNLILDVT